MTSIKFERNVPIIPVLVRLIHNGEIKDLSMALDTGSTYCTIPRETAKLLGLIPLEVISTATADKITYVQRTELDGMSLNGAKSTKVEAIIKNLPERSYVDGLLGLSFLRNFDLTISFKNGLLKFSS